MKSSVFMQPVEEKRGEKQCVYAASGGKERQRAACICSQWRQREAKSSVYMQPVEAKRGKEQHVCVERVWGANLQRIVPFV